jgi:hypothetical protein
VLRIRDGKQSQQKTTDGQTHRRRKTVEFFQKSCPERGNVILNGIGQARRMDESGNLLTKKRAWDTESPPGIDGLFY